MENYQWRTLTLEEKEVLGAYYKKVNLIGDIFFRIPQAFTLFTTLLVIINLITEIAKSGNIGEALQMFLALPFMYGIFFFLPMLILKAYHRERRAIEESTAVVCYPRILAKHSTHTNGRMRHLLTVNIVTPNGMAQMNVKTNMLAYDRLNEGNICAAVFFPQTANSPIARDYITAFECDFESCKDICEAKEVNSGH